MSAFREGHPGPVLGLQGPEGWKLPLVPWDSAQKKRHRGPGAQTQQAMQMTWKEVHSPTTGESNETEKAGHQPPQQLSRQGPVGGRSSQRTPAPAPRGQTHRPTGTRAPGRACALPACARGGSGCAR